MYYQDEIVITQASLGRVWWYFLLRGLLAGALGLCALIWPSISLSILLALVGIFCLVDGITSLIGVLRSGERGLWLVQAIFETGIGAVLLFWPSASIRFLLIVIGIWLLFSGISQLLAMRDLMLLPPERNLLRGIGITAIVFGLILTFWPGTGVVAIAWTIAAAALLVAALLISLAMRLKRLAGSSG